MITKTAIYLNLKGNSVKALKYIAAPAAVGGFMATKDKKQRNALIDAHGLPVDANLGWRNAGRTVVGAMAGGLLGGHAGSALAQITKQGPKYIPALGKTLGAAYGIAEGFQKYSPTAAKDILRRKATSTSNVESPVTTVNNQG